MDEDYAKGVKKELEHIGSQAFWDEVGDESKGMHEEVQQTATEPGQKSSVECFYKESDSQEDKEEGEVDVDEAAKFFGGYEHLERCGITIQDGGPGGGGGRKGAAADRSARDGVNDGRGEAFEIPEDLIKRVRPLLPCHLQAISSTRARVPPGANGRPDPTECTLITGWWVLLRSTCCPAG